MKIYQLNAFLAAVETGSIRAAARKLFLCQSALTKALRELEEELETPLIKRSVHGITLTDGGNRLLGRARVIVQQLELAQAELRQLKGADEGVVAMGVSPLVAVSVLPRAVAAFRLRYKRVALRVTGGMEGNVVPGVRQGVLDFGVMGGVNLLSEKDLAFQPWFSVKNVLLVRTGHPMAQARTLKDLVNHEWLLSSSGGSGLGSRLMEYFRDCGLPNPPQMMLCETTEANLAMLRNSDMIGFGPESMVGLLELQGVSALRLTPPPPRSDYGLVTRVDSPLAPVAETFAIILRDLCAKKFGPYVRTEAGPGK